MHTATQTVVHYSDVPVNTICNIPANVTDDAMKVTCPECKRELQRDDEDTSMYDFPFNRN